MTEREEQRGQEVHGPQTNIRGDGTVIGDHSSAQVTKIHIGDKVYSRSQLEELDDYLAQAVAAYEARMYQHLRPPTTPPDQPYKFLYAFEIEDAPIFFGREAASEELHETVLQNRMTVLHASSGAGKTSLLKAGLSPRLIREGRLPVYARAYEDPVLAVKQAIAPPSQGPWPELLPKLSLHELLGLACKHLKNTQELVIILDQFEEFFIFWPMGDHRRPFVEALANCCEDESLPVRFVISIRDDYFGQLATFKECLPHIFHNECYLGAMTREGAQAAITGPVSRLDREVTYEAALLDTLLDDLTRDGVELPHLQIICTQLYQAMSEDSQTISLAAYEELGSAGGILGGYLNRVLDRLPPAKQAMAKEVLKELVSSEATKRVLTFGKLKARLGVGSAELEHVLAYLVGERLLHRGEDQSGSVYEIAHEYLIEEIETWLDKESLAFKQAQELLEREVVNWRDHGTLIPKDRLEVLYEQREHFNDLPEETWQCIIDSALHEDFAVEEWAEVAGEEAIDPLVKAWNSSNEKIGESAIRGLAVAWDLQDLCDLGNSDNEKRARAVSQLGNLGDACVVDPLIALLGDESTDVHREAAKALRRIGGPAVEPLIAVLDDEGENVREAAAWALGWIGDADAVEPLITALDDEDGNVRREAAKALGRIGDAGAVKPLVAVLGDEDGSVRRAATKALRGIGEPAVEPLVAVLGDEEECVRWAAIEALGRIGEPAVEPLIAALGDEARSVRRAAAEALRQIGTPDALAALDNYQK